MCTVWPSHSKWLSEQRNESASHFAVSLNVHLWIVFRWFRRPQLWATGNWQLHHNNAPTHASHLLQSFFDEISSHPGDQPLYSPDLAPRKFWLFQKQNLFWKGRDFRASLRLRKIRWGSWWWLGELCEVPRCLLWRGLRHHVLCTMVLVSSSINVSIFHITWLGTFWTDLVCLTVWYIYLYLVFNRK